MSGISYKAAGSLENKRKFNDGTELNNDFDINLYETYFRSYDAQIGRFHQIDELADFDFEFSPYSFANNNPISMNDPFGLETEDAGHRKHKETSTPENPKTLDPVVVKGYLKKDHSLASGSVLDNFVTHKKAESDEWSNQRSDYEQKREAGLNSIAAAVGLPSEKSHSFEVGYRANQDYRTVSYLVASPFIAYTVYVGGYVAIASGAGSYLLKEGVLGTGNIYYRLGAAGFDAGYQKLSTGEVNYTQSFSAMLGFLTYGIGSQTNKNSLSLKREASFKGFLLNSTGALLGNRLSPFGKTGLIGKQEVLGGFISGIPGISADQINTFTDKKN